MKVKLGYVAISKTIKLTASTNYTYTQYQKNKDLKLLDKVIISDLESLEEIIKYNQDVDIMLEAKAKDEALFRLVRELKYKTNYKFINDTTFIVE